MAFLHFPFSGFHDFYGRTSKPGLPIMWDLPTRRHTVHICSPVLDRKDDRLQNSPRSCRLARIHSHLHQGEQDESKYEITMSSQRSASSSPNHQYHHHHHAANKRATRRGGGILNEAEREYILRSIGRCRHCGERRDNRHNNKYGLLLDVVSSMSSSSHSSRTYQQESLATGCEHCCKDRHLVPRDILTLAFGDDAPSIKA